MKKDRIVCVVGLVMFSLFLLYSTSVCGDEAGSGPPQYFSFNQSSFTQNPKNPPVKFYFCTSRGTPVQNFQVDRIDQGDSKVIDLSKVTKILIVPPKEGPTLGGTFNNFTFYMVDEQVISARREGSFYIAQVVERRNKPLVRRCAPWQDMVFIKME